MSPCLRVSVSVLAFLVGCAPRVVAPLKIEAMPIRRISIEPFEGIGGAEVAGEFARSLTGSGLVIVDRKQRVDAVLSGTVHEYQSAAPLMVFLGDTKMLVNDQMATVSNPVVSRHGSQVLAQGAAMGVSNPHLRTERAAVSVSARLVEVPGGRPLWVDEFSYEHLEQAGARKTVVTSLARSLLHAAPQMKH